MVAYALGVAGVALATGSILVALALDTGTRETKTPEPSACVELAELVEEDLWSATMNFAAAMRNGNDETKVDRAEDLGRVVGTAKTIAKECSDGAEHE